MLHTPDITGATSIITSTAHVTQQFTTQPCQRRDSRAAMLITLLLISQVSCEWVEIAQQHFEKPLTPVRPTHNYPSLATVGKDDAERTTKRNRIYINHSLSKYNWNKGDQFEDYQDTMDQVHLESSTLHNGPIKHLTRPTVSADDFKNRKDDIKTSKPILTKIERIKTNYDSKLVQEMLPNNQFRRIQFLGQDKLPTSMTPQDYRFKDKPIEILNLSDLDTTTEEDLFTTVKLAENKKNHQRPVSSTVSTIIRAKPQKNRLPENNPQITEIIGHSYKNNKPTHVQQTFVDATEIETEDTIQRVPTNSVVKRVYLTIEDDEASNEKNDFKSLVIKDIYSNKEDFKNDNKISNIGKIRRVTLLPDNTFKATTEKTASNKIGIQEHESSKASNVVIYETEDNSIMNGKINNRQVNSNIKHVSNKQIETSSTEKISKIVNNRYNNFIPIKTIPDPDQVMLDEILKDEDNSEEVHKLAGTVKRVQIPKKKEDDSKRPEKNTNKENHRIKLQEMPNTENGNTEEPFLDKEVYINTYKAVPQNIEDYKVSSTEEVPFLTTTTMKYIRNGFVANKIQSTEIENEQVTLNSTNKHIFELDNNYRRIQSNSTKNVPEITAEIDRKYLKKLHPAMEKTHINVNPTEEQNPTFVTKEDAFETDNDFDDISSTEELPRLITIKSIRRNFVGPKSNIKKTYGNYDPIEVLNEPKPTFVTNEEIFEPIDDFISSTTSGYFGTIAPNIDTDKPHTIKSPTNDDEDKTYRKEPKPHDYEAENQAKDKKPITTDKNAENIENVVKLIKVVANTISRNTKRNFKSKMRYLEDLRDTILYNIGKFNFTS